MAKKLNNIKEKMMSENLTVFSIVVARLLCCSLCLVIAYGLAREGKDGWGWFLFVALCLGSFSVKTGD